MKTNNILLFVLTGAVLLVVGFLAGSFFAGAQPDGDSPDTIIKEWRGSATGTIAALTETVIIIEKDGAKIAISLTPETEVSKSVIDEEGVEEILPLALQSLEVGTEAHVAVTLSDGRLKASAIRVIE